MKRDYSKSERRELRGRWEGQGARISAITQDLCAQQDWTRNLLASEDPKWDEGEDAVV